MEILEFDVLESTHTFLADKIKKKELVPPVMVVANRQTNGIGSRGNLWEDVKEGLYFSFAIRKKDMPNDLNLESAAIFYGFIFKEILKRFGSKVWLKYPNDLYLGDRKFGGVLCTTFGEFLLVGIGINKKIKDNQKAFGEIDVKVENTVLLEAYICEIEKFTWKQIFSKYELEFTNNFSYSFHNNNELISMKEARLCVDGSLDINGKKIYNLRNLE